ncbi:MAG TPA: hypothetical protein VHR66_26710 [Gemmataceae bacterium]|nr:hypothetical protein [Gemmataceae bacterium]
MSITFGRLAANETIYFSAFLELANPAREKSLGSRIADTHEAIAKAADGLAKALQSEGELIITGNDELYDLMKQVRFWHFHPEYLREDHPDYRPKDQR